MCPIFSKFFLLLLVKFISECLGDEVCPADLKKPWSYNSNLPNGPEHWGKKYPACKGKTQSPINIETLHATQEPTAALHKIRYNEPIAKFNLENTGYTAKVTPKDGVSRAIQIKGHTYTLDSFHFHWGNNYYEGSEHNINGVTGSMEIHLVHKDKKGNIAVLGALADILPYENEGLAPIVKYLPKVKYAGNTTQVDGTKHKERHILLSYLLPFNSPYFIYTGSLTTPPCTPNVTWVVFNHKSYIDEDQITHFRELSSTTKKEAKGGNCNLGNNFRPIQASNKRKVLYFKRQKMNEL